LSATCPECSKNMKYDREMKIYTCTGCGLTLTRSELLSEMDKRTWAETDEDKKKREQREYLKWWTSPKNKK